MTEDPKAQAQADLIYAILTKDSYNRGYGSGISKDVLPDDLGTKIGIFRSKVIQMIERTLQ